MKADVKRSLDVVVFDVCERDKLVWKTVQDAGVAP